MNFLHHFDDEDCYKIYGNTICMVVPNLARIAEEYHYGYLVCSAKDLWLLRDYYFDKFKFQKIICPGIRPEWYQKKDDQKRVMTPSEAIKAGADLLVIGRPILNHTDPVGAIMMTNEEIKNIK